MEARWILVFAGKRASFLEVILSLVRVCVLFRKTWRRWLLEDEIRFSQSSLSPGGASSVAGWRVEMSLRPPAGPVGFGRCLSMMDPLDPSAFVCL
jgi:hypothetical protein